MQRENGNPVCSNAFSTPEVNWYAFSTPVQKEPAHMRLNEAIGTDIR